MKKPIRKPKPKLGRPKGTPNPNGGAKKTVFQKETVTFSFKIEKDVRDKIGKDALKTICQKAAMEAFVLLE